MAIFVFCVNLLVAAFILTFAVEISTLLIGSLVYAVDCVRNRRED